MLMKRIVRRSAIALAVGATLVLPVATPSLAAVGEADKAGDFLEAADGMPIPGEDESCWYDISLDKGLCVRTGEDLIAAVAEEAGVRLEIADGEWVGGRAADVDRSTAGLVAPLASYAVSTIYDGASYGSNSYSELVEEELEMKLTATRIALGSLVVGGLVVGAAAGISASAVSADSTKYSVNESGQTYGTAALANSPEEEPDLIAAQATNGIDGYVLKEELDPPVTSLEEAARSSAESNAGRRIDVYESDGKTVVGKFEIGGYSEETPLQE